MANNRGEYGIFNKKYILKKYEQETLFSETVTW